MVAPGSGNPSASATFPEILVCWLAPDFVSEVPVPAKRLVEKNSITSKHEQNIATEFNCITCFRKQNSLIFFIVTTFGFFN